MKGLFQGKSLTVLFVAVCFAICGADLLSWGWKEWGSDRILPASPNWGPMTAGHAVLSGLLCLTAASALLITYFRSGRDRK
jgi:hypothetical protein